MGQGELDGGVDGVDGPYEGVETLYRATPEHRDIIQESFKQPDWD